MSNELTLQHLLPVVSNTQIIQDKLRNSTFIGIDFGTSTTVVSYAILGDNTTPIKTDIMPIRQLNVDGSFSESHLVPSCIAWFNEKLFIGQSAKQYKNKLQYGKNLWYSFKMKLGEDNGAEYYRTELPKGHSVATIENSLDATKVFMAYLKKEIDYFISKNNLPSVSYYSVSIPASFESNQRKDLKEALNYAGIPFQDSLFIDEPNAAFLSFLVESNSNNFTGYNIPIDSPLHILVFDFGAGTCDISILEIGRKSNKLYSKNIAISKYEQLGGDDIDKQIVKEVLFPQLLKENNITADEIKTPEYQKIILPRLQIIAEFLKVKICKNVSANMTSKALPTMATSEQKIDFPQTVPNFRLPQKELTYTNPSLSFKEFSRVMETFLSTENDEKSVFTVIESAMKKANLNKDYIDLVLFVGGSSYNPYIQSALYQYFNQSEIAIPQDLQSLVSNGAGINSFLQNGLGVDMINPIVSEPILIILQGKTTVIIKEGTEIPCRKIDIEGLYPQKDGQQEIEIPICVSSTNKILNVIKIKSENKKGFSKSDNIRLECHITHDKLIHFKAFIKNMQIQVEPLNPFANRALTTEEIAEKKLLKEINNNARQNGGKPSVRLLKDLIEFYKKTEKYLKVAETYESIQQLKPNEKYQTNIYYYYSKTNNKTQEEKWVQKAYEEDRNYASIHNYALFQKEKGNIQEYEKLMEEAISIEDDKGSAVVYGEYLYAKGEKERAMELFQKAYDYYFLNYSLGVLDVENYHWLIRAASYINEEVEQRVRQEEKRLKEKSEQWFNKENLATDNTDSLTDLLPF
ncbi:Hsp70 family protein [Capnocytophaga canis]|uniref:Hsp70 family protein n=1 Tax=Capnocytophaga canis TaxID=1848903 RepID=UPI0037CF496C